MGDEELPTPPHARGYRRLADFMAWSPQTAMFSRFRAANALNILGMQAEICRLQKQLVETTIRDEHQDDQPIRKQYQYNWASLEDGEDGNSDQRQLILKLRKTLKQYSQSLSKFLAQVGYNSKAEEFADTALLQQITLSKQEPPAPRDFARLREWVEDIYGLASDLRGPGSRVLFERERGEHKLDDKVAIWSGGSGRDSFTNVIFQALTNISSLLPYFLKKRAFPAFWPEVMPLPPPADAEFVDFSTAGSIVRAGDKISTVLSCLLITLPVVALNYATSTDLRLGLIVLFTLIFSLSLAFMSDASRKEIFAATAAFVAVQAVYVGSGCGTCSS